MRSSVTALNLNPHDNPDVVAPCTIANCNATVSVFLSRGTRNPSNAGYYYEACNAPASDSHWLRWRKDLGRHPDYGGPSASNSTALNYPTHHLATPSSSPVKSSSSQSSPTAKTPNSTSANTFDNATSKDKGHGNSQPEESTGGQRNAVAISGGKCTGPRCMNRANPPRFARGCIQNYCQACCNDTQLANQELTCSLASHGRARSNAKAPPKVSSSASVPGGPNTVAVDRSVDRDDFYDATKPLTKAHYDVRNRAHDDYQNDIKATEQREKQDKLIMKHIVLLFWKENDAEPEVFKVTCPQHPYFALSHCSPEIREAMGTVSNTLIQLYDCGDKRWITHETETLLSLRGVDTVLSRAKGVTRGNNMSEEIDKLLNHGKSRKRPADASLSGRTSDRSVRARTVSSDSDSLIEIPKTSSSANVPAISKSTSHTQLPASFSGSISRPRKPGRITGDLAIRPKPFRSHFDKAPQLDDISDSDTDNDEILFGDRHAPASKKSAWPLKYVEEMVNGFYDMANMTGTLPQRFSIVFSPPDESLKLVKGTWKNNYDVFKAATPEELQEFMNPGALWKKFRRTVRDRLARQADKGQAKRITVEIEPGLAVLDSGYSTADNHDCTFCDQPLPATASATLISLRTELDQAISKRKIKKNSPVVTALYEYCARHTAEAMYEAQPQNAKWPLDVDFSGLGFRLENLMDKLQLIWTNPTDNYFYKALCLQIGQDGESATFSRLGDFKSSEITSVGYFGEKGALIMSCVLQLLFDDTMDNNGISVINFIRRVLLPEAAVLLAQEDMGLTRQDAVDIIRTSKLWGLTMHPDDDTNHGGAYYMDLQKRREQKAKRVKREIMDIDSAVQVPTVTKKPTGNIIIPTTVPTSASTSSTILAPTNPTVSKSSVPKGLKQELVDVDLTAANSEIGDVVFRTIVDENGDEIIEID